MDDLKLIKKHYGEKMSHLCRELFPTILETEGLLYEIITKKFNPSRLLYEDIMSSKEGEPRPSDKIEIFKNIIYKELETKEVKEVSTKTPEELMDEAGYTLYECKSIDDVKQFEKYYEKKERLCTFWDIKGRLERCHVFFAVKKNVDEIKREGFKKPKRQDEYGTSVISIQFSKGIANTLSIKNRYNHVVDNPDATFSNNLDNIIEGLTYAFEKKYDFNINANSATETLPYYVLASDGKYYRYSHESNNIYYCPDNIIIDYNHKSTGKHEDIVKFDKSKYVVFEGYILNMQTKKLHVYEHSYGYLNDQVITPIRKIKSIKIINDKENKEKTIIINDRLYLTLDNKSQLIKYKDIKLKKVPHIFLESFENLREVDLPEAREVGCDFLSCCENVEKINLPKATMIGECFMSSNTKLKSISLPNTVIIGDYFLNFNKLLNHIELPKVKIIGKYFLMNNCTLNEDINMPEVEYIGDNFLYENRNSKKIYMPKLKTIKDCFLYRNVMLEEITLPNCTTIRNHFLISNKVIKKIELPQVEKVGDNFLIRNESLKSISLPNTLRIGKFFLRDNKNLEELDIPDCMQMSDGFLESNQMLTIVNAPNLIKANPTWSLTKNQFAKELITNIVEENKEKQKIYSKEVI